MAKAKEVKQDDSSVSEVSVVDPVVATAPEDTAVAEVDGEVSAEAPSTLEKLADDTLDSFISWAQGGEVEDDSRFVSAGLVDEGFALTDVGVEVLDNAGVPWGKVNLLTLGIPVTYVIDNKKFTIQPGSTLRVISGGNDERLNSHFWDCTAGERLPITRVYQNRNHIFTQVRYPALQQPKTVYTHED